MITFGIPEVIFFFLHQALAHSECFSVDNELSIVSRRYTLRTFIEVIHNQIPPPPLFAEDIE